MPRGRKNNPPPSSEAAKDADAGVAAPRSRTRQGMKVAGNTAVSASTMAATIMIAPETTAAMATKTKTTTTTTTTTATATAGAVATASTQERADAMASARLLSDQESSRAVLDAWVKLATDLQEKRLPTEDCFAAAVASVNAACTQVEEGAPLFPVSVEGPLLFPVSGMAQRTTTKMPSTAVASTPSLCAWSFLKACNPLLPPLYHAM